MNLLSPTFRLSLRSIALALGLTLTLALPPLMAHAQTPAATPQANAALIRESMARHIGTLAYIWGYPMVDMSRQMHNETHRLDNGQFALAPVNHFYRYEQLVTPTTSGELRGPNNDTLYFGGWFDLSQEPIIIQTPDTHDRYYTLALTDFFNEVQHLGRRTTGTQAGAFALIGPDWKGPLPANVKPVHIATRQVWILGRLLVDGPADFPQALGLMRQFWAAPLSQWTRDRPPPVPEAPAGQRLNPMHTLEFFTVLNQWLRHNAVRPDEGALVGLFDQAGFGPRTLFNPDQLDPATRKGLEQALIDGQALLRAASNRTLPDVRNGWIFPLGLSDYGHDYLLRAGVVLGGYANRPEETVYPARTTDSQGRPLSGQRRYSLHFAPGQRPPVNAFWSITAYDLNTFQLIDNPLQRYSIGDRTRGLRYNPDGSLDIHIQKDPPAEGSANWLPVGDGPYLLVARLYEPGASVFNGTYQLPQVIERP